MEDPDPAVREAAVWALNAIAEGLQREAGTYPRQKAERLAVPVEPVR
jgi:hypothetical protein